VSEHIGSNHQEENMQKAYCRPNFMPYRNMSSHQRLALIQKRVHIPKHLIDPIKAGKTPLIVEFNAKVDLMARGKIAFDTAALVAMVDQIDRARWATPPREGKIKPMLCAEELPVELWQVGDIVSRDGNDEHEILAFNDCRDLIEVRCIKEPPIYLGADEPWTRLGETDTSVTRRYSFVRVGNDQRPPAGTLPQPSSPREGKI
jgi:hypothetical protein